MSEKRFKIDTTSEIGHIYINNQDGEHMSWIEVENTLNEQQAIISELKKENKGLKEKLDDVLELTEFVGMTSLRKAEIKSIVNR